MKLGASLARHCAPLEAELMPSLPPAAKPTIPHNVALYKPAICTASCWSVESKLQLSLAEQAVTPQLSPGGRSANSVRPLATWDLVLCRWTTAKPVSAHFGLFLDRTADVFPAGEVSVILHTWIRTIRTTVTLNFCLVLSELLARSLDSEDVYSVLNPYSYMD